MSGLSGRTATRARRLAERRRLFLEALAKGATVGKAATAAGVSRRTPYKWRNTSKAFAEAWDEAEERGTDVLEDEAVRRAVQGVKRPVFQQGRLVGHEQQYSDNLLALLLRARRPEKFSERVRHDFGTGAVLHLVIGGPGEAAKVINAEPAAIEHQAAEIVPPQPLPQIISTRENDEC